MPINVVWQDENCRPIATLEDHWFFLADVERAPSDSVCLRFVDPYGDTVFNRPQIPVLIAELEAAISGAPTGADAERLRAIQTFVARARDEVHTYIRFVGD